LFNAIVVYCNELIKIPVNMKKSDIKLVSRFRYALRIFEREQEFLLHSNCCKGLTLAQCHTLLEIGNMEQPSLRQLTKSLKLDKSTVSRTVDGLTNLDLVERYVPHEDRRTLLLSLTVGGRETYDDINTENNTYFNEVLSAIPAREREVFINSFEMLANAMVLKNKDHDKKIPV
jgi:DNA-binding MarR family transcriptional regulator